MDLKNITGANKVPAKSTGAEINTGTNDTNFVTPKSLADQIVLEKVTNKKSAFQETPTDAAYPSEKLVKDSLDAKQDTMAKASGSDIDTGTDDAKYVTAKALKDSGIVSTAQAGEFSGLTEKTELADDDLILIEDSEAEGAKKKVKKSALGGGSSEATLIAGEAIYGATTPKPIFINDGVKWGTKQIDLPNGNANVITVYGQRWDGQSFVVNCDRISKITLCKIRKNGTPPSSMTLSLYATSGGLPTGSALGSVIMSTSILTTGSTAVDFVFTTPITVTNGGTYAWVLSCSNEGDSSNAIYLSFYTSSQITGTELYTVDAGASWIQNASQEHSFILWGYTEESYLTNVGAFYLSKDADLDRKRFDGFVIDNTSAGNSYSVKFDGLISGFSSLSPGKKYYIDSSGALTTTVGTYSVLVGIAINSTTILIIKDILRV